MQPARKQHRATQARLIESACEVFAEKGFRDATIAEICERAGANVAAANYYFRDKERLYTEAWRLAFHRSLDAHPAHGGVPPDAPAWERLRGRILSIMRRIADPGSHDFEIVHKELANPTGLLAEVTRESLEPIRKSFSALIRELLGEGASERQVQLCQMSIMAQCFNPMMRERRRRMLPEGLKVPGPPPMDLDLEVMADHILRFSLAGIHEIRSQIESGTIHE